MLLGKLPSHHHGKQQAINLAAICCTIALNALQSSLFLMTLCNKQQHAFLPLTMSTMPKMLSLTSSMQMTPRGWWQHPFMMLQPQSPTISCSTNMVHPLNAQCNALQLLMMQSMMMLMLPTSPMTMMLMTTLVPLLINALSITAPFLQHLQTLNHFKENFQQLSQAMAQLDAVKDCINHILQPKTNNRLIVSIAKSNPTPPYGHAPSPTKPPHPNHPQIPPLPAKPRPLRSYRNLQIQICTLTPHP